VFAGFLDRRGFGHRPTGPLFYPTYTPCCLKLTATIIAKNEASCIADCLHSLQGEVDEIVVCDTGSEDDTVQIVRDFAADPRRTPIILTHYTWNDHFADARNAALAAATGADWCVVIDCDEVLAKGTGQALRKCIKRFPGTDTFRFWCQSATVANARHTMVRAHRRSPEIVWQGRIHEALSQDSQVVCPPPAEIVYGYSDAHQLDPDRCLRLLLKDYTTALENERDPEPRTLYYLAREYWYRLDYATALYYFQQRTKTVGFRNECADAWLYVARCLWQLQRGDEARTAACQALLLNPEFKEVHLFLAEACYEPARSGWLNHAQHCTNENVLFVRTP